MQLICLRLSVLLSPQKDRDTSLAGLPKNQGAKTEQEWERGPDDGKGDELGTHITLSQRGVVWAADVTAIYQVHFGPCY